MTNFYIKTAGCSANQADSEMMAGLLKEAQFNPVDNPEDAYIIILNTCTVKTPSENAFFKLLNEYKQKYPHKLFVIAGCIAQTDSKKLKKYPLVGPNQIHKIVQVVEEALNDNVIKLLAMKEAPSLNLARIRKNPLISIIPISRGCLGACTFCKTKQARGNLISYPIKDIVKEVKKTLQQGAKEIWLTSQDTFCYGFDIKTDLPTLLEQLLNIPSQFKIRIGMGNPNHLLKIKDKLIEVYQHPKVFKFLHLPLQSGHNDILQKMKRNYSVEEYLQLVKEFKTKITNLNLMTDVIVGFPGETDDHYWNTLEVVRKIAPDSINISRFWSRPGTVAAKMKQLPSDVIKRRSKVLTDILQNISKLQNEKWIGWEGALMIDERGKEDQQWIGRNNFYKQIIVEGDFKLGDLLKVKLVKANVFDLRGEVLI